MYCPDCGAEYRPEVQECPECRVPLAAALPAESGDPNAKIVPAFRTTNAMILPLVKSLLESAGIDYYVQGEGALGLLPVGAMGSAVSRGNLGAIVHVNDEDLASVREMLAEIGSGEAEIPADVDVDADDGSRDDGEETANR